MTQVWFTADTHFGHANVIAYCFRPFPTLKAMHKHLVAAWNGAVMPGDVVVHVGDVCMARTEDVEGVLAALHGQKLLILGNHDLPFRRRMFTRLGWHMLPRLVADRVAYQHRPIDDRHSYNLVVHGHAHGNAMLRPKHFDVGVDVGNWQGASRMGQPIPAHEILRPYEQAALCGELAQVGLRL